MSAAGLYVHVPFCSTVCPYCDFAVRTDVGDLKARFVAEVQLEAERSDWRPPLDTVYLGGGTPSRLDAAALGWLLDGLRAHLPVTDDAWILLEANPEDVTADAAHAFRDLGVDAVSLGAQSLDPERLRFLGRTHAPASVRSAVAALRAAGIGWLSIDLIYGLPGDTTAAIEREIDAVVALAPEHVSAYQLTVHDGTRFGRDRRRDRLTELAAGRQAELFARMHERLAARGYPAYEVSNFARGREHRSRHNTKYWDHTPYLGLGPSAHSFDGRDRWWNRRRLADWARALAAEESPIEARETLSSRELALEAVLLGLRTSDGLDLARLEESYGVDLVAANRERVDRLVADGLAELATDRLRLTVRGLAIADAITRDLTL